MIVVRRVAGTRRGEYWTKYHGWQGVDLRDVCSVLCLDRVGLRGTWTTGGPITAPVAVAASG